MSFPAFDRPVPDNGYAWWYVDAVSDDGRHALTIIGFIGNVFSPYYRDARRRRPGGRPAIDHCAINVALYGPAARWAMTERGRSAVDVAQHRLSIGPSRMHWQGDRLIIEFDERGTPWPRAVRGQIVVRPRAISAEGFDLDPDGQHHWHPVSPICDVQVTCQAPALAWQGHGYLDHNRGSRPLEADFRHWQWSRVHTAARDRSVIHYDVCDRNGHSHGLALHIDSDGAVRHCPAAPWQTLPRTRVWRMPRRVRSEGTNTAHIQRTLEDTPFYARSEITAGLDGQLGHGIHESVSLDRLTTGIVGQLLRFRMPRDASPKRRRRSSA